ncbi:L,D-transpeptidase catalytic domain [Salinihabitans flavidus]|uniref:L,D-transpeptidase catalytic domain n=1 Tax=Salinihabitans flavidus TaxID=569882 RepID=A0A1H8TS40_9RHOB|nr:L,D-transpeptidase [Salinihabitans flavidus]SEO93675.1 L,D-transpeptidase catalytic domain [Salinihabitans flavidus]
MWRGMLLAALLLLPTLARAESILARIDLSGQWMQVVVEGELRHIWPVSTARDGKCTPTGTYRAQSLSRFHRSSLYNNAPMPFSIFFHGNYAIHGTDQTDKLGSRASAGCVRLHPTHAEILFEMTRAAGPENLSIVIRD